MEGLFAFHHIMDITYCCGLTRQAAKHHVAIHLLHPLQLDGRENQEKINK